MCLVHVCATTILAISRGDLLERQRMAADSNEPTARCSSALLAKCYSAEGFGIANPVTAPAIDMAQHISTLDRTVLSPSI